MVVQCRGLSRATLLERHIDYQNELWDALSRVRSVQLGEQMEQCTDTKPGAQSSCMLLAWLGLQKDTFDLDIHQIDAKSLHL